MLLPFSALVIERSAFASLLHSVGSHDDLHITESGGYTQNYTVHISPPYSVYPLKAHTPIRPLCPGTAGPFARLSLVYAVHVLCCCRVVVALLWLLVPLSLSFLPPGEVTPCPLGGVKSGGTHTRLAAAQRSLTRGGGKWLSWYYTCCVCIHCRS